MLDKSAEKIFLLLDIEKALLQHDRIKDCAVIGYTDVLTGELAFAFIVKKDPQLTDDQVKKYLAKRVSREQWLHGGLVFVKDMPRNESGKMLKCKLNEMLMKFVLLSKL